MSFIHINNLHRSSANDHPNKFTVNLGNNSVTNNVTAVTIKSISFCNTQYNVRTGRNRFYYSDDGINPLYVTVTVGQYTTIELLQAVKDALFTLSGRTLVWASNPITKKIEVSTCVPAMQFFDYAYGIDNPIGMQLGIIGVSGLVNTLSFDNTPDLSGLTMMYIRSSALSNNHSLEQFSSAPASGRQRKVNIEMSDIIDAIGCEAEFGFFVHHEGDRSTDMLSYETPRTFSSIDIELTDSSGSTVDLNGAEVIIVLEVFH